MAAGAARSRHVEKFRRVAAQRGVALADAVQEIEVLGLREPLRFGDALGESIPGHDGLDGGERIAARLLGLDQRLADAPEQPHLGIDRLAGCLELLLMLVLGGIEQLAQDAVMQVDDFVGDGGHALDGERHQGRVTPLRLELRQVGGRHLAALAGDLEQPVLVNQPLDAGGQVERLPRLEAFDVFQHVPRVRFDRGLPQPGQPRRLAVVAALEQIVEATAMHVRQRLSQGVVETPVGAGNRFGARPLDGVEGGHNDRLPPQVLDQGSGQHDALVGLHGQLGQQLDSLPVVANRERLEAEHRLQLDQVLASGLLTLPVLVPAFDADLELVGDQSQQWRERWLISAKDDAGKAQVAELHREAQPIGRAAPLPDDGEVAFAERVVTDQLILGVRQRQQAFALGGGEDRTAGHAVSFFLKT